jgi:hypothetical protein
MSDKNFEIWKAFVLNSSLAELVERFGCGVDCAKSWKCGRIVPKAWQIPIYLKHDLDFSQCRQERSLSSFKNN